MVLRKMLLICSPLLPFKDFSTASLKVDINHISGSLSFRHCTLPLEISRQGVSKQAWFFHLLLLIQEFFYSTFKRAHDPSASSPTLSNAALRSSLPFIPHFAGQQTSFTAPKSQLHGSSGYRQTSLLLSQLSVFSRKLTAFLGVSFLRGKIRRKEGKKENLSLCVTEKSQCYFSGLEYQKQNKEVISIFSLFFFFPEFFPGFFGNCLQICHDPGDLWILVPLTSVVLRALLLSFLVCPYLDFPTHPPVRPVLLSQFSTLQQLHSFPSSSTGGMSCYSCPGATSVSGTALSTTVCDLQAFLQVHPCY